MFLNVVHSCVQGSGMPKSVTFDQIPSSYQTWGHPGKRLSCNHWTVSMS